MDAHFGCQEQSCDKHCLVVDGKKNIFPRRDVERFNPQ
jgi:hypothetical protein